MNTKEAAKSLLVLLSAMCATSAMTGCTAQEANEDDKQVDETATSSDALRWDQDDPSTAGYIRDYVRLERVQIGGKTLFRREILHVSTYTQSYEVTVVITDTPTSIDYLEYHKSSGDFKAIPFSASRIKLSQKSLIDGILPNREHPTGVPASASGFDLNGERLQKPQNGLVFNSYVTGDSRAHICAKGCKRVANLSEAWTSSKLDT